MAGLTIAGGEPFPISALSGSLSTMFIGAVPLVYAQGRNAAIGTVICSAVILVVLILLCCPQETDGFSVRAMKGEKVLKVLPRNILSGIVCRTGRSSKSSVTVTPVG
jgi:hypothetical protein